MRILIIVAITPIPIGTVGWPVKTTEASLSIIETVHALGGATLNDLDNHLDMAKSTLLNHLTTLKEHGYLVQEGQIYYIGLKFLYFGERAKRQHPAFQTGQDLTHGLAHNTNEEADFSVNEHGRLITLHHEIGHNNEPGGKSVSISICIVQPPEKRFLQNYPRRKFRIL